MRASSFLRILVPAAFVAPAALIAFAACTDQVNPVVTGAPAAEAAAGDSATDGDTGPEDAGAESGGGVGGSATIAGSVGGVAFTTVMSAYVIGSPDNAATTAVYLIGAPAVGCAAIGASGWGRTIPAGTQIFEMIMATKTPAADTYTVSTAAAPPVGSAEVQYVLAAATKNETRATSGTVTLSTLTPNGPAVGKFKVQFPSSGDAGDGGDAGASALEGTFNAVFCAAGHEP